VYEAGFNTVSVHRRNAAIAVLNNREVGLEIEVRADEVATCEIGDKDLKTPFSR